MNIYKGFLNINEYGCLECGDLYLISEIESNFKKGDKVFVRYFLSDKEITEGQAKEALILKTFGGDIEELDFVLDAYSEHSINELEEHLVVDGHDLLNELQACEGKFLLLIIDAVS